MKRLFVVLFFSLLLTNIHADDFDRSGFIGNWGLKVSQKIDKNVILELDGIVEYYESNRVVSIANFAISYKVDGQEIAKRGLELQNSHIIVGSYSLVTLGKWKIQEGNLIEEAEHIVFYKNNMINTIEIKDAPIDAESADMIARMIKEENEKNPVTSSKISKISKDEITVVSNDEEKVEMTLVRR